MIPPHSFYRTSAFIIQLRGH